MPAAAAAQASLLLDTLGRASRQLAGAARSPALLVLDAAPEVLRRLPATIRGMSLHHALATSAGVAEPNLGVALRGAGLSGPDYVMARKTVQSRNAAQHPVYTDAGPSSVRTLAMRADAPAFHPGQQYSGSLACGGSLPSADTAALPPRRLPVFVRLAAGQSGASACPAAASGPQGYSVVATALGGAQLFGLLVFWAACAVYHFLLLAFVVARGLLVGVARPEKTLSVKDVSHELEQLRLDPPLHEPSRPTAAPVPVFTGGSACSASCGDSLEEFCAIVRDAAAAVNEDAVSSPGASDHGQWRGLTPGDSKRFRVAVLREVEHELRASACELEFEAAESTPLPPHMFDESGVSWDFSAA